MQATYITPDGSHYVTYNSLTGTYDVRAWPAQTVIASRDWLGDARREADRLAASAAA